MSAERVPDAEPERECLIGAGDIGDDNVGFGHQAQQLINRESGIRQIIGPEGGEVELFAGRPYNILVEDR
ncbi:hypothetical protein GCM10010387_34170 [Streptomyces inusitatus]|uniref:Uncharacterized protein n=1 Tax=Streptomyces inusitatus TaxID=68221 RepID=A0A918Q8K6_9ACTN|nr:hypothetical protein GCM10010387_34170 [Streptomyces inusitatus]